MLRRLTKGLPFILIAPGLAVLVLLAACGGTPAAAPATQAANTAPAAQASSAPVSTVTPEPSRTTRPTSTSRPTSTVRPTATPKPSSTPRSAAPATSQTQVSSPGTGWQKVGAGTTVQLQSVSCPSAKLCLASGARGTLLKSTDGGATWQPRQINQPDTVISQVYCQSESACLALDSDPLAGTGGIYASGDGGETWTQTESWDQTGGVIDMVNCAGTGACYGIGDNGIFKGDGSGVKWSLVNNSVFPAPPPARYLVNIACPSDQSCVALGQPRVDEEGIILSLTNGGTQATRATNLDPALQALNFDAITCPNETTCFAAGSDGVIIKSEDGGATWTRLTWTPPPSQATLELRSISCPGVSTCIAVGGNPLSGQCCGVIIRTADGGKTWTNEKLDLPYLLWSVSCTSETDCVAVGDNGLVARLAAGGVAGVPAATSTPQAGEIITNAVMAGGVKGFAMPTGVTDTFPPDWKKIYTVVTLSNAPSGTRFKIMWTAVDVGSAASPNTKIGEFSDTLEGSGNSDYYFSPSGKMAQGTYKVDLFVNDKLDRTLNFYVRNDASAPNVDLTPSPVGSCPAAPTHTNQSAIVQSITMAKDTDSTTRAPVNPTSTFGPKDKFHAAVSITNAPDNTRLKAVWFATDVGDAAPCNYEVSSYALTTSGSTNLDFTLDRAEGFPVGLYRVEVYVDDQFAMEADFSVQ